MKRQTRWATGMVAFFALGAAAQAVGCFPLDYSESTGGASGGGGTGGYQPPACPGDPVADPALVRNDCGTFVSASAAPGGDGTMERPLQSFSEAAALGAKRIYACAESYTETAAVAFSAGVEIFAGFTACTGEWTWDESQRATLTGAPDAVALTLDGGSHRLRNVRVMAPDATVLGGSSIAVVVNGGSLELIDSDLTAGTAREGAEGDSPPDDVMLDGDAGDPGVGVCMAGADNIGPMGKTKVCPSGESSVAGKGGDGGELMMGMPLAAGSGTDGTPADAAQPTRGKGGVGQGAGDPAAAECADGTSGVNGAVGSPGAGATGIGTISLAGYGGVAGAPGTPGKPGQGGGGGGGSRGGTGITCNMVTGNRVGASGGAGGTGGCGGAPGGGGQAGGSSIALIALDATLTFSRATLTAGRAGSGGTGGSGQNGGQKGLGGTPGAGAGSADASCRAGDGGTGGDGGPGGGGQGGHAVGIAFTGTAPTLDGATVQTGDAGIGGVGTGAMGNGADGVKAEMQQFP